MWKFIQSYVFNFLSMLLFLCRSDMPLLWSHQNHIALIGDWHFLSSTCDPHKRSLYNIVYCIQLCSAGWLAGSFGSKGTDESDRSCLTAWKGQLCEALVTSVIWLYCNGFSYIHTCWIILFFFTIFFLKIYIYILFLILCICFWCHHSFTLKLFLLWIDFWIVQFRMNILLVDAYEYAKPNDIVGKKNRMNQRVLLFYIGLPYIFFEDNILVCFNKKFSNKKLF